MYQLTEYRGKMIYRIPRENDVSTHRTLAGIMIYQLTEHSRENDVSTYRTLAGKL
jgi:hypothetical protein